MIVTQADAIVSAALITAGGYMRLGRRQKKTQDTGVDSNQRLVGIEAHITALSTALSDHAAEDARNFADLVRRPHKRRLGGLLGALTMILRLFL